MRHLLRATVPLVAGLVATTVVARPAHAQYEAPTAEVETFVAPTGGPIRLTAVSMTTFQTFLSSIVDIYAWNGSDIAGPSLFRAVLGPRFVPGISLAPDIALTPGATYAFALFPPSGSYSIGAAMGPLVQGGQAYRCHQGTGCVSYQEAFGAPGSQPQHFVGFSATFTPVPVTTPEPATLALSASGLLALAAVTARRRHAR